MNRKFLWWQVMFFLSLTFLQLNPVLAATSCNANAGYGVTTIGYEFLVDTCISPSSDDNTSFHYVQSAIECQGGTVGLFAAYGDTQQSPAQLISYLKSRGYKVFRNQRGTDIVAVSSSSTTSYPYQGWIDGKSMTSYANGTAYTDVFDKPVLYPSSNPDCGRGDFKGCFEQNVGSTVNVATGNLSHDQELFSTKSPTDLGLSMGLHYRTQNVAATTISSGWSHSYEIFTTTDTYGNVTLWDNGIATRYTLKNGAYVPELQEYGALAKANDGTYSITWRDGKRYAFNTNGKIAAKTDRYGNTLSFSYNGAVLTTVTDPLGQQAVLDYYGDGHLRTITDPNNKIFTFNYTSGNLTSVVYPGDNISWSYHYTNGLMDSKTDPAGFTTNYSYNGIYLKNSTLPDNAGTKALAPPAAPANPGTIYPYTIPWEIQKYGYATFTGASQEQFNYKIDLVKETIASLNDPAGKTTTFTYYTNKNLKSKTVPRDTGVSFTTFYTYDNYGNVKTVSDPIDLATTNPLITADSVTDPTTVSQIKTARRYDYDNANYDRITKITDALASPARVTTFDYSDEAGFKVIKVTDPELHVATYRYNGNGTLHDITEGNGRVTTFNYKSVVAPATIGQLESVVRPDGVTVEITQYDNNGNIKEVKVKDINGVYKKTVTEIPDDLNRLTQLTYTTSNPAGDNTTSFTYDNNNNLTSVTDPEQKLTRFENNFNGQTTKIINVIDGVDKETSFTYGGPTCTSCGGGQEKLRAVFDARQMAKPEADRKKTEFKYDAAGRVQFEIDPEGRTIEYLYYDDGNLKEKRNTSDGKNELLLSYKYNNRGDVTEIWYGGVPVTTFGYFGDGRLQTASNADVTYTFDWYANGWIKKFTDSRGYTVSYDEYDGNGQRKTVTYGGAGSVLGTVTYDYYPDNKKLQTIHSAAGDFTYEYDSLGRKDLVHYPNGTVADYEFDDLDRLTSLVHSIDRGASLASFTYIPKPSGNLDSVTGSMVNASFRYDDLYRLLQRSTVNYVEAFQYDEAGNRMTGPGSKDSGYDHDNANRMKRGRKLDYDYDDLGNQVSKTLPGVDGKSWIQTWDQENRLVKVEKVKGDEKRTVTFSYDPFGLRIGKTLVTVKKGVTTTASWSYFYDDEDVAVDVFTDEAGSVTTTSYVHGLDTDDILAMIRNGNRFYYHSDHLGSVVAISNANKQVVQHYDYDSYGLLTPATDFVNSYTYTGREWDKETGLYYYRARFYDPLEGRFVSKDPIGFAGGDFNLYGYVWNQPIDWKDPSGQNTAAGAVIGGALGGPPGAVVGAIVGTGIGVGIGWAITHRDGKDAGNDPKVPGVPTADDGYKPPRNWNGRPVPNPNGPGRGFPDKAGRIWCPTGPGPNAHGGPHWDVQNPDGTHTNVYPGGKKR